MGHSKGDPQQRLLATRLKEGLTTLALQKGACTRPSPSLLHLSSFSLRVRRTDEIIPSQAH